MLTPGQTIGRFEVRAPVGQGGMGAVYVGFDPSLGRQVALKVMHENLTKDPVAVERFRREALALAKLSHPGVVGVYDLVESDGRLVLVMEHLVGASLRQRMGEGPMPVAEAVGLARALLAALDAAHGVGVLHRDLKPANVFVTSRGEGKLLDFGVARLADATRLTETGELLGTVRYMAPELLRGEEPSARSDLYAVGFILFEMLAGRPPYDKTGIDLVLQIRTGEPPRLGELAPEVPADVAAAVDRALAADPAARFESAAAFLGALPALAAPRPTPAALDASAPAAAAARAAAPIEPPRGRGPSRGRGPWIAAAAVLAAVGISGAVALALALAPARRRAADVRTLTLVERPAPSIEPSASASPLASSAPPLASGPPSASAAPRAQASRIDLYHRYTGSELGLTNDHAQAAQLERTILSRGPAIRQCVEHATMRFARIEMELREQKPPRCDARLDGDYHYVPFPCCQAAIADLRLPGDMRRIEVSLDIKRVP